MNLNDAIVEIERMKAKWHELVTCAHFISYAHMHYSYSAYLGSGFTPQDQVPNILEVLTDDFPPIKP